jgi:hypothetical protein
VCVCQSRVNGKFGRRNHMIEIRTYAPVPLTRDSSDSQALVQYGHPLTLTGVSSGIGECQWGVNEGLAGWWWWWCVLRAVWTVLWIWMHGCCCSRVSESQPPVETKGKGFASFRGKTGANCQWGDWKRLPGTRTTPGFGRVQQGSWQIGKLE